MNWTHSLRVYGALLLAMVTWGFSFLAIKDVVAVVPIFSLLFARFAIAALLLGGFGLARRALTVSRRDLFVLAGLAVLSPVGYFLFETYGVAATLPSHASVIIATIPIAVYLISFARRQERITWKKTAGVVVAYAGILLIIGSSQSESGASLFGDLLILGAVACASVRTSLIKDALRRVTPLQLTFYQFFFSLLVFAPLAASDGLAWLGRLSPLHVGEILFLGVMCSAVAFLAMHYALVHLSATQVAVAANVVPVITLLAEILLLGASLTVARSLGTAVTIGGVLLVQLADRPPSSSHVRRRAPVGAD